MKQEAEDQFFGPLQNGTATQNAALCWRLHRGRVQVLLITSRDTGRWIMPKGWPINGKSASETAATEAWEEAGVQGVMNGTVPFGFYTYDKVQVPKESIPCHVSIFPLRVKKLAESKQRRRKRIDAQKAARKVAEPDLRSLLSHLCYKGDALIRSAKGQKRA